MMVGSLYKLGLYRADGKSIYTNDYFAQSVSELRLRQ